MCISVRNQTDFLCQLIKRYLFQFQFPLLVCFYSMAERETELTADCSLRISLCNLRQRKTSQHTVDASDLPKHSRDQADSECVPYVVVGRV